MRIDGVEVRLVSSKVLMDELTSVLAEERITKYIRKREIERFLKYVGRRTTMFKVRSKFKVVEEDSRNDVVLNTAYSGRADYIVSGDRHLIPLREFKGIRIVTVSEILELIK